jgi:hypothetical protein
MERLRVPVSQARFFCGVSSESGFQPVGIIWGNAGECTGTVLTPSLRQNGEVPDGGPQKSSTLTLTSPASLKMLELYEKLREF